MKTKKFYRAGYRVHFDRLRDICSDISAIRTHKFKCEIPKEAEEELKQKFEEVSKVVDSSDKGSVLWFLTQLYGLGFLFVSKEGKKNALLRRLYNQDDVELEVSDEYKNHIKNPEAFLEFVTKTSRNVFEGIKNDCLPQSIIKSLCTIFEPKVKITAKELINYPIIKKVHDGLLEIAKNNQGLSQEDLQQFFGAEIESIDTSGTTFVIQEIPLKELKINAQGIDIYKAYFRYLSKAAKQTGYDIQSLAGVSENQNALANLLNKSLKEFQTGSDNCKRLLEFGNPEYFEKNPDILNFLSKIVHQLSCEISPASKSDFIAENWAEYRALLGGRLQGWLSNFQNRLDLFTRTLAPTGNHQKVFDQINENCDWKNIFPQFQKFNFEKLLELRPKLFEALQIIKENTNQKDFGSLLREYNQYLQGFREFLMKWNNEGIPENIDDKKVIIREITKKDEKAKKLIGNFEILEDLLESKKSKHFKGEEDKIENLDRKILGYWSKNAVPVELSKYPNFIGESQKDPLVEIKKASDWLFPIILEALKLAEQIREINISNLAVTNINFISKNLERIKELAARHDKDHIEKSLSYKFYKKLTDSEEIKFFVAGIKKFSDYLSEFKNHFGLEKINTETDVKNWLGFKNDYLSWDTNERGEILKIYLSLLLRNLNDKIKLPSFSQNFSYINETTLAGLLFEENGLLKSEELAREAVQRFFASSVGSEIRGKISVLSRTEYIKRNVIQITNGSQSLLQYVPVEWGNFDHFAVKTIPGKRKKFTERKLKKLLGNAKKEFSSNAEEILDSAGIDSKKSNAEIAKEIWKKFDSNSIEAQKKLAQVLAEIPHRWKIVLKTRKSLPALQPIENGLFLEKSNDKNIFVFCTKKKSDYLYSFPVQTSIYQKQFLERFLIGDHKEVLEEKIMGASIILERTIDIKSGEKGFSLYCSIPFQFSKEEVRPDKTEINNGKYRLSTKEHENILGINLDENGFGWAIFNPVTEKFEEKGFQETPLLRKMRDAAASWKDSQARGIFSRPTTYLAEIREQAAGQTLNQIHHLAIKYNAKPIYEDSIDKFESGGQRISKLYKTLKTADVISGASNKADGLVRKHFWGTEFAQIGGVIGVAKNSETCRDCGVCKTAEIQEKIKNSSGIQKEQLKDEHEKIKNSQLQRDPDKEWRGNNALFICQSCGSKNDAGEQAAQNIALKFYLKKYVATEEDKKNPKFQTDAGQFSSLKFFLERSKKWTLLKSTSFSY